MQIRILGCSGGIGGTLRTTSILINDNILIDAGTGLGDLTLEALAKIDYIFLTHSHLDHIACLPLLVDSVISMRSNPIQVYALPETISTLRAHIFNWHIWPDFSEIPSKEHPFMTWHQIEVDKTYAPEIGVLITPLHAEHTVPALGYYIHHDQAGLVFSGDTCYNPSFWQKLKTLPHLHYLIIETAFANRERSLAERSKHLCPSMLAEELQHFTGDAAVYITHLKPNEMELIMQEVAVGTAPRHIAMLTNGHIFEL